VRHLTSSYFFYFFFIKRHVLPLFDEGSYGPSLLKVRRTTLGLIILFYFFILILFFISFLLFFFYFYFILINPLNIFYDITFQTHLIQFST
jgi:hypothetical protein